MEEKYFDEIDRALEIITSEVNKKWDADVVGALTKSVN